MRIVVLGSAAGGGSPQWNCRCPVCELAWAGDPRVSRRTQASLAVSLDDRAWCLIDCSPDIREQIASSTWLKPSGGVRGSPIRDVVLSSGDIDRIGGLLSLREGASFVLHASAEVLGILAQNRVFEVLAAERVSRRPAAIGVAFRLHSGLSVELFPVPGKLPLFLEREAPQTTLISGFTVGIRVAADGSSFHYVPGCAELDAELASRLRGAGLVFFDGTLWTDDEMIRCGTGSRTGRRMGHMPVSGPEGSLHQLAGLGIGRLIYTHINNTNPMLIDGSPERRAVEAAGAEVAYDGLEIEL